MAQLNILNPTLIDNGTGNPFNFWSIGANAAWSPSDSYPLRNGADGGYNAPGDNSLFQNSVFSDYGTGVSHIVKINIAGAITPFSLTVLFGTVTAATITTTGINYAIGAAAGNATLKFNITQGYCNIDFVQDASNISILSMTGASTNFIAPVYNPIWFEVSSMYYSQPNFRYVFDVFTGTTASGNPLARVKLLPRPTANPTSAPCLFSPARILESYLSYDARIQNIVQPMNSANHMTPYIIKFGQEYGLLSTGTTVYSGLTYFSGYCHNAVLQYEQVPGWDYTDYLVGSSSQKFLTNQPRSGVKVKNSTDRGTLSFMQIYSAATKARLITYQNSGGTITNFINITGVTANNIIHLPAGPWNLNHLPNSAATINLSTDYKYTLEAYSSSVLSEPMTYLIDTKCSKYDTVRLQFLNRLGTFDYFNFDMVSRKTVNVTRNTFRKVLAYNYQLGDRGESVLDIDGQYSYSVQSDWVNQAESNWLEELVTSPEVYVINSDGTASPIIIDDNSIEIKKTINDKLFAYSFNYHAANKLNGQRN